MCARSRVRVSNASHASRTNQVENRKNYKNASIRTVTRKERGGRRRNCMPAGSHSIPQCCTRFGNRCSFHCCSFRPEALHVCQRAEHTARFVTHWYGSIETSSVKKKNIVYLTSLKSFIGVVPLRPPRSYLNGSDDVSAQALNQYRNLILIGTSSRFTCQLTMLPIF